MWLGKVIAGLFGWIIAGPIGALAGLFLGHQFDKGMGGLLRPLSTEHRARIEQLFFETVFRLLGHLAKADGRISEQEITHTESLMSGMGLTSDHRRQAITLFKEGAAAGFSAEAQLALFVRECAGQTNLKRMLLNYLIALAIADGQMDEAEERVLRSVAEQLGFSRALFERFLQMIRAQAQFRGYQGGGERAASASDLDNAYAALGVTASASDAEIKKAYRKLVSENHPDKLIGQGMPEDMIKLATERTQEVHTAYELIGKSRQNR